MITAIRKMTTFEEERAKAGLRYRMMSVFNANHCILVTNGTAAIELVLKALPISRGDCVIVPDISFIATATAVANAAMVPIFADTSSTYFGITLDSVKRVYNKKTKAIIVVHFAGYVNREIDAIRRFCDEKGVYLIEDCAQALLCRREKQPMGTIGHAATFSFQTSKPINSGEGGAIITNSDFIAERCESMSNWGLNLDNERDESLCCSNFRMSGIQSYLIEKQLKEIGRVSKRQNRCFQRMLRECTRTGAVYSGPAEREGIEDSPFFFPVKSKKRIHAIEPRSEYPMRKSKMVKAIIKKMFPDLLQSYENYNRKLPKSRLSDAVLQYNDFIYVKKYSDKELEELFKEYTIERNCYLKTKRNGPDPGEYIIADL
jgi:dTDP-4-amino-4,6-dideoxygalactose transaminase